MSCANETLLPSTLPFLMGSGLPSGPRLEPVSVAPSALNVYAMVMAPPGVSIEPVHLPSMSAAKAGAAASTSAKASVLSLICSVPLVPFVGMISRPHSRVTDYNARNQDARERYRSTGSRDRSSAMIEPEQSPWIQGAGR